MDSNINEIDVKAVAESSLAKVEVSSTKLKVGVNKITISVISESGSKGVYELVVTREDYDSIDNYLKNLIINDYPITFNRNVFNYEISIANEKSLAITPVLEKSESTYSIVGNSDLKNDSIIVIKVSDTEGSTREYNIKVKKNSIFDILASINIDIKWIILGLEFLIILILLLVIIFRNNSNKPKKVKTRKVKVHPTVTSNACKACGTVNDMKSKICYVCGNLLK